MFTKDGRMLWIRHESTVVHDEDGTPLCLQGVLYDISDSKRAVEERDFQARLLESISDAVIAYDTEHDRDRVEPGGRRIVVRVRCRRRAGKTAA